MPLEAGKSRAAFSHNVEAERAAGKPEGQAVAIAYSKARGDVVKKPFVLEYLSKKGRDTQTESYETEHEAKEALAMLKRTHENVKMVRRGDAALQIKVVKGGRDRVTGKSSRNVVVDYGGKQEVVLRGVDPRMSDNEAIAYVEKNHKGKLSQARGDDTMTDSSAPFTAQLDAARSMIDSLRSRLDDCELMDARDSVRGDAARADAENNNVDRAVLIGKNARERGDSMAVLLRKLKDNNYQEGSASHNYALKEFQKKKARSDEDRADGKSFRERDPEDREREEAKPQRGGKREVREDADTVRVQAANSGSRDAGKHVVIISGGDYEGTRLGPFETSEKAAQAKRDFLSFEGDDRRSFVKAHRHDEDSEARADESEAEYIRKNGTNSGYGQKYNAKSVEEGINSAYRGQKQKPTGKQRGVTHALLRGRDSD